MNINELPDMAGLAETQRRQDGLLTRSQALSFGVKARNVEQRVTDGRWARVFPSVYLVSVGRYSDFGSLDMRRKIRAAALWGGPDSIIATHAAAWWLGLKEEPPPVVELWVPPARRKDPQIGVWVRRRSLDESDTVLSEGIRLTSKARTAIDLSAVGSTYGLDALSRKRQLDAGQLDRCLMRGSGSRGWVAAREAVAGSATDPWSAGERPFHQALRNAGLVAWVANVAIKVGPKTRIPDVRFADVPLLVEVDSKQHHGSENALERDSERDSEYAAVGWTCLRFTVRQILDRPTWVVGVIVAAASRLEGQPIPPH